MVGSQLAQAEQKHFFSQSKQRCHTTVRASSAFGYVWWGATAQWLWMQASSRQELCCWVSLIPCLPLCRVCLLEHHAALTLRHITHLQADSHPASTQHGPDKCSSTLPQLHRALWLPPDQGICTWLVWGVIWEKTWRASPFLFLSPEVQYCLTFVL